MVSALDAGLNGPGSSLGQGTALTILFVCSIVSMMLFYFLISLILDTLISHSLLKRILAVFKPLE